MVSGLDEVFAAEEEEVGFGAAPAGHSLVFAGRTACAGQCAREGASTSDGDVAEAAALASSFFQPPGITGGWRKRSVKLRSQFAQQRLGFKHLLHDILSFFARQFEALEQFVRNAFHRA